MFYNHNHLQYIVYPNFQGIFLKIISINCHNTPIRSVWTGSTVKERESYSCGFKELSGKKKPMLINVLYPTEIF